MLYQRSGNYDVRLLVRVGRDEYLVDVGVVFGDAGFDDALLRRRHDWHDFGHQRSKVRHLVKKS